MFKNDNREEIFLVYRSDYPIWVTTGGGMEPEESPKKAALREAEEETGFKIKITRAVGIYYTKEKGLTTRSYLFEGRVTSGKFRPEFPAHKQLRQLISVLDY